VSILSSFLLIAVLIFLNGLFVAAEFAIIGVRPTRIRQLAEEGHRAAAWLENVTTDRRSANRYIATAQLGITLASLGLGMYAEPSVAHLVEGPLHDWFGLEGPIVHTISLVIALLIITYLHVVIGEMVPKSLALQNAEKTVLSLAQMMRFAERLFALPVRILNWLGLGLLRLLRVPPPSEHGHSYTPDELELIVSESQASGLLEAREKQLITNIFDFTGLHAVDFMTPRTLMQALPASISEAELLERAETSPHSRLPVYEDNIEHIIGILHLKDFVRQQLSDAPFDLRAMLRQAPFVPETMPAETLLNTFKKLRMHMAIVIDEHGSTAGLVTLEDLLEEVVGELWDEYDTRSGAPIEKTAPGHLSVEGTVLLDDLAEMVRIERGKHEVRTVGGFVLASLGRPAEAGDEVLAGDVTLRVEAVDGMTIRRVSVSYPAPGSAHESR
jgi:CBS domain containing-hemolysin-like protein